MHCFLLIRLQRQQPTHRQSSMEMQNAQNGFPETDWRDVQYDMLYLPVTESIRYHCDQIGIPREMTDG